jgi:hypothetical protein
MVWLGCVAFAGACGDDAVDENGSDAAASRTGGAQNELVATGPHTGGPGASATETNVAPLRDASSDCDDCDAGG